MKSLFFRLTLFVAILLTIVGPASAKGPQAPDLPAVPAAPAADIDLSLAKTASASAVQVGEPITYTLSISNLTATATTGVVVTDTLPAEVTFISAGAGCTQNSGVVVCNIGDLTHHGSASRQVVVSAGMAGEAANHAAVAGNDHDPNTANNHAQAVVTISEAPVEGVDLALFKSASTAAAQVGDPITYTLTISNLSATGASGVTLTDTLPISVTFVSASAGCTENGGAVVCSVGDIGSHAGASLIIVTSAAADGVALNQALVAGDQSDPHPSNNHATASVNIGDVPPGDEVDVHLMKSPSKTTAEVGDLITYTLSVMNMGHITATGVIVTDTLPAGVTFVSAREGCTENAGVVTCTIAELGHRSHPKFTVVVIVDIAGEIINKARVRCDQADSDPTNNEAAAAVTVTGSAAVQPRLYLPLMQK